MSKWALKKSLLDTFKEKLTKEEVSITVGILPLAHILSSLLRLLGGRKFLTSFEEARFLTNKICAVL